MASSALPSSQPCCNPCLTDGVLVVQIPGPAGAEGNGTIGADGVNAFTYTSAAFTMPAEGATVSVQVLNTSWMVVGQKLFVQVAQTMEVTSITTALVVVLKNVESTASSAYTENAAPGTNIPAGSKICPSGLQGPSFESNFNGHYAGGTPTQTPSGSAGTAFDLDAPNNFWHWNPDSSTWV